LAALLHGTLVVGVTQTLRHWTESATYIFGRADITLGTGPHSSYYKSSHNFIVWSWRLQFTTANDWM